MSKIKFVSFLFLLVSMFGYGQTKEIDSLKAHLKNTHLHDTVRIKTYFNLAGRIGGFSLDSLKKYTMKAVDLSKVNNNFKLDAAYFYMALYHSEMGDIAKAKDYYLKTIPLIDSIKDKKKLAIVLSNYANDLNETTELEEKIAYNFRAIKLREELKDKYGVGQSQFNLAVTYSNTGFDSLSVKYLKLALKNVEESKEKELTGYVLNSLVMYSLKSKNFKEALVYLQKSEKICKETGSNMVCYNTFLRKGEYLEKQENFEEAEIAYKKSLNFAKESKSPNNIMFVHARLGKHYVKAGKPVLAIENFQKFEENKKNPNERKLSQLVYGEWSKAEKMVGNYKKSNEYLQRYIDIKDSLNITKNKILLTNSESKYQSEKKDKEIAQQNLQLVENEKEIQKKKTQYSYMTGAALLLLVGLTSLWFIYQQRQKRKDQEILTLKREQQVQTLESLMEGEEKERIRISKELHDGVNVDLSAIKYKLTSMLEKNNEVINEVVTMIDKSCEQVRAISHNLVPQSLKDFSIIETIENFCTTNNSIHDPEITFTHIGDAITISKKAEVNIFRIVQELVNNSIKHAEATEINVQLSNHNNNLQLTVEDNGKGFKKDEIKSNGIGLKNIQSRVDYLAAKLDFSSNENGTSYIIDINTEALS